MSDMFQIIPIGIIRKTTDQTWMEIDPKYQKAMNGLELYSHIHVLYWFHENDTPKQRQILEVHPCNNPVNPLTGVFATHSPMRPNLIALTVCHILSIDGLCIRLKDIDARDATPVIDIKGYFPYDIQESVRHPNWERRQL
ncbi:MAG TPA: tRNA (N6-threonylcarbamoyladenosine(37)-N6)-methyltransferase TrmO [Desulfatirhabdiaceae bacterium]|nr:tRNA (N6-threonylcarbamoyladenosine(37)-N6)-methyltransferase TrmO [Desulfatirhabdiaceae bacterium]